MAKKRIHSPISSIDCSPIDSNLIAFGTFDKRVYFTDSRNLKQTLNYFKVS
jgi:hypothetical protein